MIQYILNGIYIRKGTAKFENIPSEKKAIKYYCALLAFKQIYEIENNKGMTGILKENTLIVFTEMCIEGDPEFNVKPKCGEIDLDSSEKNQNERLSHVEF